MPVRKTESRLPSNFLAADLGQTAAGSNASIFLVSYLSAPIVQMRIQDYFVFVTDAAVAATIATYNWTINDNGVTKNISTTVGVLEVTPQNKGTLTISVKLMSGASALIDTVTLVQTVVSLNTALEVLIDQQDKNFPSAANPATSREAINDLRMYVDALLPPAQNDLFNKFLLSTGYAAAMATQQVQRNYLLESYANLLNTGRHADLLSATEKGIGICKVRPQVLTMFLEKAPGTTYTPFVELPTNAAAKKTTLATIQNNFNALSENDKIDLFNVLRFPKSNYKVAKLVFEKLKDKYFATSTLPQILGVKADTQKLVVQYETGPIAGTPIATAFAKAVFNIMQQQVWTIAALPMVGTVTASGPAGPSTVPFGSPEHIPDLTFIVQARDADNGYIRNAFIYHDSYGLNPTTIKSFEDLVLKLSKDTTPISRMRLVSHFYIDPLGKHDSAMFMPFFTPSGPLSATDSNRFTIKEYFKFGVSDEAGLARIAADFIASYSGHITDKFKVNISNDKEALFLKVVMEKVRASNANLLVPFSLQGSSSTPSGAIGEFIKYCCDTYFFNHSELTFQEKDKEDNVLDLSSSAKTQIALVLGYKINDKAQELIQSGKNANDLDALKNAIAAIDVTSFFGGHLIVAKYSIIINGMFIKGHDDFRNNLAIVKNRFSSSSVIDVRGCRIGQDAGFLDAVKNFFGNPGSLPKVTAPDWYQSFPTLGYNYHSQETGIDGYFNSGIAPIFSSADVQREYSNWSGRIGIPSHISFWQQLANGNPFDFFGFSMDKQLAWVGVARS